MPVKNLIYEICVVFGRTIIQVSTVTQANYSPLV